MCFSAPVSFMAATFLALTAYASLRAVQKSSQWFLACIPLLFSIQQGAEGVVWLTIAHPVIWLHNLAASTFIMFAFLIWPVWIPIAIFKLEKKPFNQTILKGLIALGALFCSYAAFFFITGTIATTVEGCHIVYTTSLPHTLGGLIAYTLVIIGSFLVSSESKVRFLGILIGLSCGISLLFWKAAFISVWCFFAAILSLAVVHLVRGDRLSL